MGALARIYAKKKKPPLHKRIMRTVIFGTLSAISETCKVIFNGILVLLVTFGLFVFFGDSLQASYQSEPRSLKSSLDTLVVLYTRENCYNCKQEKAKLDNAKISYHEVSMDTYGCVAKSPNTNNPANCIQGGNIGAMEKQIASNSTSKKSGSRSVLNSIKSNY